MPSFSPQIAFPTGDCGLKGEPARGYAVVNGGLAVSLPTGRLGLGNRGREHCVDRVFALRGFDIPGEGDEVAPETLCVKEVGSRAKIAPVKGLCEL